MTSRREKMIWGRENCKNGREKKYNGNGGVHTFDLNMDSCFLHM